MTWDLSNQATQQDLERIFTRDGVGFDASGFCDTPEFLACEQRDPRYLELYARYVEAKAYDATYLAEARQKITTVAGAVRAAVEADGRLGACVDASMMIGRMLDRLSVWNYVAKSTLTIDFPATSGLSSRYFWAFNHSQVAAPHAIVVAPPFYVVDVTVRYQGYDSRRAALVPARVLADTFEAARWQPEDIAPHDLLDELRRQRMRFDVLLAQQNPDMASVLTQLPTRLVRWDGTSLKYAVVAVGGSIEPLEGITGYCPGGRTALQIFEQDVLPALA